MTRSEAEHMRSVIETASQSLDDETALTVVELYPSWEAGASYPVAFKARHGGVLYRCLTEHTSQESWSPDAAHSLWAKVLVEDGNVLPWEQPDSTNAYMKGDRVTHNGSTWSSDLDDNVWEPGVYGWTVVE